MKLDKKTEKVKTIKAFDPKKQKKWPCERPIEKVGILHAYNTKAAVKKAIGDPTKAKLKTFNFEQFKEGDTVIDVGMGTGRFIRDCRKLKKSLKIIGAGANLAKDDYINSADTVYYQFVPDHPHLLEDFSAEADYVFDTFGAGTYANNPANALIYEVCLKSPDNRGCISMIASLVPGNKKYSTFGNAKTQKLITDFFKERMDVKVDIRPTYLESGINPGNIVSDLLITAKRSGKDNKKFSLNEFKEFSLELKEIIGTPVIKNTWANEDFEIHSYDYVHLDEESMSVTDTEGSESVEVLETDEMGMTKTYNL